MKRNLLLTVFVFCSIFLQAQSNGSIVRQVNADFRQGKQGWQFRTSLTAKGEFAVTNGRAQVKIIEPGPNFWSAALSNPGIKIEKGRTYKVEFEAMANPPINVGSEMHLNREQWNSYSKLWFFKLTEKNEKYSYTFSMWQDTDPKAAFSVGAGGQVKSTVTLGNVRITDLGDSESAASLSENITVKIARAGGTPISPFAFGNNYFNWLGYNDGPNGILGTEETVKALHLNVLVGDNNQNDANTPQLFDKAQVDKYIQYCRAVGAEPIMIAPVYGNNVNGGPTSAQGAADIVTYINGTRKYGVKYWTIGDEVDIYDLFFKLRYPVSNASEYAAVFKSYANAMKAANAAAQSGVELKFVGPELGWRYFEGNDWLSPMLDECKDYIDVVSIHLYGFAARDLSLEGVLNDVDYFRWIIKDIKDRVAKHARPGTPLAITEANISYDWDPKSYSTKARKLGPGTFYAAIWDADRMGVALEADLWTFAFWDLAEPVQGVNGTVFGFILTDPYKNPSTYKITPEYYAQQMVAMNFSGTTVVPSGVPVRMSVYASYDEKKASTAILVVNKDMVERPLTLAIDSLKTRTINFSPMSINIVTVPDDDATEQQVLEYTKQMADAGLPPRITR